MTRNRRKGILTVTVDGRAAAFLTGSADAETEGNRSQAGPLILREAAAHQGLADSDACRCTQF